MGSFPSLVQSRACLFPPLGLKFPYGVSVGEDFVDDFAEFLAGIIPTVRIVGIVGKDGHPLLLLPLEHRDSHSQVGDF